MKYILICSCSGMNEKANIAYGIAKPGSLAPQVIKGKEAITRLASQYNNAHLRAISKLNGRFAYYVDLNENGKIIEEIDLITNRRIA